MAFLAQYQQTPVSAEGERLSRTSALKLYSEIVFGPQRSDRYELGTLPLSEAETGDYSAGVVLLNRGETFHVLEVVKRSLSVSTTTRKNSRYVHTLSRGLAYRADSPISKGLIQALAKTDVNVVTVTPDKEKRSRVIAQSDLFEGGSIFIPEQAEWRELFRPGTSDFPGGRHDDRGGCSCARPGISTRAVAKETARCERPRAISKILLASADTGGPTSLIFSCSDNTIMIRIEDGLMSKNLFWLSDEPLPADFRRCRPRDLC